MVIQVTSLTLFSEAPFLVDPNVQQLFVAYRFLDCDPADLETPTSLPKPPPDRPISFNFNKGRIWLKVRLPSVLRPNPRRIKLFRKRLLERKSARDNSQR